MAGLFDFFKQAPQSQGTQGQAPVQQQQSQNPTAGPTDQPGKMSGTEQTPPNPLDAYAKIFETAQNPNTPPAFNLDPEVLNKVSSGMDFTKSVAPELLQKATSGDMQALLQVINQVGQQAYQNSLRHSSALTDKFVSLRSEHDLQNVDSRVKQSLTNQALSSTPNYSHPVVKQQLNMIADGIARANPDASPADVAKAAQDYLVELTNAIKPPETSQQTGAAKETDWSQYLTQ